MTRYVFDNADEQTRGRFTSLEASYDPVTTAHLNAVGIGAGWDCVDIGAGSGSIATWLAERVGPRGSVLATDIDTSRISAGAPTVQVREHDITIDPLPSEAFDLVHARLVLHHLPGRDRALRTILGALRPGGIALVSEFDALWVPVLAAREPGDAALFSEVLDGVRTVLTRSGSDMTWVHKAYAAMRDAGFVDLDSAGYLEAWRGGSPGIQLHRANVTQIRTELLDQGLVTEAQIERFLALLDDPEFTVSSMPMISTWGRKPLPELPGPRR